MDEKDIIEEYNQKFWDAYLPVAPFKKISKKNQIRKYRAGLKPRHRLWLIHGDIKAYMILCMPLLWPA